MPRRDGKNGRKQVLAPKSACSHPAARACQDIPLPLPEIISIPLQQQICADLSRHLEQTAACDEFLQILSDTVSRFHEQAHTAPDPALAAEIYDTIMAQYNTLLNSRPPSSSRRSRFSRLVQPGRRAQDLRSL